MKKSSTLKFIMKTSFLQALNLHSQIHHLNFHRKKYACQFFINRKYFVPRFLIFISARILVSATNSRLCTCNSFKMLGWMCGVGVSTAAIPAGPPGTRVGLGVQVYPGILRFWYVAFSAGSFPPAPQFYPLLHWAMV